MKTLTSSEMYKGRIFRVDRDVIDPENGQPELVRDVVRKGACVAILAVRDDEQLALVCQYRHPLGQELLEVPAGLVDAGETPVQAAFRELEEETGYQAMSLEKLGVYYASPGFTDEVIHLYEARDLTCNGVRSAEDQLYTQVEWLPIEQALALLRSGELADGKTQAILGQWMLRNFLLPGEEE